MDRAGSFRGAAASRIYPKPRRRPAGLVRQPHGSDTSFVRMLEKTNFGDTFGTSTQETYLRKVLLPKGALLKQCYSTGHLSLDNYMSLDLITSLQDTQATGQPTQRLVVLTHPLLLVVDEIGYLPINHAGAVLFFQVMYHRYETASTMLTFKKGFRGMAQDPGRRSNGRSPDRSRPASRPPGQHPRQQLLDPRAYGTSSGAAVRRRELRRDREPDSPREG